MAIDFRLIDPNASTRLVGTIFDMINTTADRDQRGQIAQAQLANARRGQDMNYNLGMAQTANAANSAQMQYQAEMANISQRGQQAQAANQFDQQALQAKMGLGYAQLAQQDEESARDYEAQMAQAQAVNAKRAQDEQYQRDMAQLKMAQDRENSQIKKQELGMAMERLAMEKREKDIGFMDQVEMRGAAQQGLSGLRSYYISRGDYQAVSAIDKNRLDFAKTIFAGEKAALDIKDPAKREQALSRVGTMYKAMEDIIDTKDDGLKKAKSENFVYNMNDKYGTNYDAKDPFVMVSLMDQVTGTAKDMAGLMQNPATAGRNAGNIKAFSSADSKEVGELLMPPGKSGEGTFSYSFEPTNAAAIEESGGKAEIVRTAYEEEQSSQEQAPQITVQMANQSDWEKIGGMEGVAAALSSEGESALTPSMKTELQKQYFNARSIYEDMNSIKKEMDPKFLTYEGRIKGSIYEFKDKLNMTDSDEKSYLAAQTKAFQKVERSFNKYKKLITGVAASPQEIKMLRQTYINKDLSPTQFTASVDGLLQEMNSQMNMYGQMLQENGIRLAPKTYTEKLYDQNSKIYDAMSKAQEAMYTEDLDTAQKYQDMAQSLMQEKDDMIKGELLAEINRRKQNGQWK